MNKYTKEDLENVIRVCVNWSEVCRHYGLLCIGGSPRHMRSRADKFGIDYSHFINKPRKQNYKTQFKRLTALEYINSKSMIKSHLLRLKLIEDGIKRKKM